MPLTQVPQPYELPLKEPGADHVNIHAHLRISAWDRVRVLFGWHVFLRVGFRVHQEQSSGQVVNDHVQLLPPLWWKALRSLWERVFPVKGEGMTYVGQPQTTSYLRSQIVSAQAHVATLQQELALVMPLLQHMDANAICGSREHVHELAREACLRIEQRDRALQDLDYALARIHRDSGAT